MPVKQVGGNHYEVDGEQHWDRQYRLFGRGYFIGCSTKYVERAHLKGGREDLEKAISFIQKLIELEYPETTMSQIAQDIRNGTFMGALDGLNRQETEEDKMRNAELELYSKFNPEHAPLKSFPEVKPTGWVGFVFEGTTMNESLFTCRSCRKEVRCPVEANPADHHGCT